jgi:hypothetical protein
MTDTIAQTDAPVAAPVADNIFLCPLPGMDSTLQIDRSQVPAEVRLALLDSAIKENVRNRVNAANVRHTKANTPWQAFDNAMAADPAQTVVAKPEGERPTIDLVAIAQKAREDLYAGKLRSTKEKGEGRKAVDPLVKTVTDVVVRDVYAKEKASGLTFVQARAKVGKDGVAYLQTRIEELVAGGADRAALDKMMEERYMKPARIILGLADNKAIKEGPSILG